MKIRILIICFFCQLGAWGQDSTYAFSVFIQDKNICIRIFNRDAEPLTFFDKHFEYPIYTVKKEPNSVSIKAVIDSERCQFNGEYWTIDLTDSLFISSYFDKEISRLLTIQAWGPCYIETMATREYILEFPKKIQGQKIVVILQVNGVKKRYVLQ